MFQPEKTSFVGEIVRNVVAGATSTWPVYKGEYLNRDDYVTSSEVGKCLRQIYFSKQNSPNKGKAGEANQFRTTQLERWGFAQRGHSVESWVCEQLKQYDGPAKFMYIGTDQVSFVCDKQSGTPDGLILVDGKWYILEIKSIDPRLNKRKLPKPEHITQVIQNADIVSEHMQIDISGAYLIYINASDFEDLTEYFFDATLPAFWQEAERLEARAEQVFNAKAPEDLPAEGIHSGKCGECSFGPQCSGLVTQQKQERETNDINRIAAAGIFGQS